MSKAAQITPDGIVLKVFNFKAVNVGDDDEMIQYPKSIWTMWTDAELNAIGYAKFDEQHVPSDKRSTGTTDTFEGGKVYRSHTMIDFVPAVVIDPEPTLPDQDAWTEDVPAVMSEDGLTEVTPATTIDHPATTKPNPDYDHISLRQRDYENTPEEMIIALWEQVVESRSVAADVIEAKRQIVKARFPK